MRLAVAILLVALAGCMDSGETPTSLYSPDDRPANANEKQSSTSGDPGGSQGNQADPKPDPNEPEDPENGTQGDIGSSTETVELVPPPSFDVFRWNGTVDCAASAGFVTWNTCATVPGSAANFYREHDVFEGVSLIQSVVTYAKEVPSNPDLMFLYRSADDTRVIVRAGGASPIHIQLDGAKAQAEGLVEAGIHTAAFPDFATPGATVDQDFNVVTYVFYHGGPPAGWDPLAGHPW